VTTTTKSAPAERIQAWVPSTLAEQLRAQADLERRSISQTVRLRKSPIMSVSVSSAG
jgi:hypothetical protein